MVLPPTLNLYNMLKIHIKTSVITLNIEDEHTWDSSGYTKRDLPKLPECIEYAVNQAIKLHNETKDNNGIL